MEILNFKGQLSDLIYILKKGGSIHIKKKNRGKFTDYCGGKVTEECIAKGKKSKDPKIRKRATFAANARKWKHENGGIIKYQNPSSPLINRVNKSKANFVQRLLDPNRKSIQNWVNPLSISTHKLGWATEDTKQGAFVYPEVQEINGELVDFTNPIYRRSEGINSAVDRRDTVRMTPEQAKWFTENYKQYYPGFQNGGNLYSPHPLSPVGIALNQARAMTKIKGEQPHLPLGVKEVVGPDGKKIAIRTEQPLVPLEQSIAEWLPGTGDVAEVGYIANDVKNGNYGNAALAAGLMLIPGSVANKLLKKSGNVANVRRSFEESLQKASDFYKQPGVFEYFQEYRRNGGVGVDLDKLDRMNIEIPVDAHGIAKGDQLAYLFDLLDNGVDTSRPFHSAPLFKQVDPVFGSGLGPGLGTGGGKAYRDGPFIIAAKPGKTLKEDGIGTVLINDFDGDGGGLPVLIQEKLRKMYPNVDFIRYSAAPDYYKLIK